MPSASRMDALSGSRFFAFSRATVAWAARPPKMAPALLEEIVGLAHALLKVDDAPRVKLSADRASGGRRAPAIVVACRSGAGSS